MSELSASFDLHILVAEDNTINQMLARKLLEKAGCSVELVDNGQKALEALSQKSFDLILMDCMMPVMDGFEATRNIRASGQSYSDIPIIAFTANEEKSDQKACEQVGMNDFIHKPISPPELQKLLTRWQQLIRPDR